MSDLSEALTSIEAWFHRVEEKLGLIHETTQATHAVVTSALPPVASGTPQIPTPQPVAGVTNPVTVSTAVAPTARDLAQWLDTNDRQAAAILALEAAPVELMNEVKAWFLNPDLHTNHVGWPSDPARSGEGYQNQWENIAAVVAAGLKSFPLIDGGAKGQGAQIVHEDRIRRALGSTPGRAVDAAGNVWTAGVGGGTNLGNIDDPAFSAWA